MTPYKICMYQVLSLFQNKAVLLIFSLMNTDILTFMFTIINKSCMFYKYFLLGD